MGMSIGQRCIYIKPHGLVPVGAKATVLGIYGVGDVQEVEMLLDRDSFGATSLHGRTPAMRGVMAPVSAVMPIPQFGSERATSSGRGRRANNGRVAEKSNHSTAERSQPSAAIVSLLGSPPDGPAP